MRSKKPSKMTVFDTLCSPVIAKFQKTASFIYLFFGEKIKETVRKKMPTWMIIPDNCIWTGFAWIVNRKTKWNIFKICVSKQYTWKHINRKIYDVKTHVHLGAETTSINSVCFEDISCVEKIPVGLYRLNN